MIALALLALVMPREGIPDESLALLETTPARVTAAQAWFYDCTTPDPKCRRKAYVRRGDIVLTGAREGRFVRASFSDGAKRMTEGWLERSALTPMPTAPTGGWAGKWVRDDEGDITVRATGRPGAFAFKGSAMYGTHDPALVKSGGINVGEFSGIGTAAGGRITIDDENICLVKMRLIGPYLVAADNGQCGGLNVSFSGVYRRGR